jgi:hypothetical protein
MKTFGFLVGVLAAFSLVSVGVQGCGGSDDPPPQPACDVAQPTSCGEGLVCKEKDGAPACLPECDVNDVKSCGPNKLCKSAGEGKVKCVPGCLLEDTTTCKTGLACEEVEGGEPLCFSPVVIAGKVIHSINKSPIENARVTAKDEGGAVNSDVAVSDKDGNYALHVPAKRKSDGTPVSTIYTLRADAAKFATFPGGLRPALPVDIGVAAFKESTDTMMDPMADAGAGESMPAEKKGEYVVQTAATTIALIPLTTTTGLGTISGKVTSEKPGGTLVVTSQGRSGIADLSGNYVVFNVPSGSAEVHGYAAGVQLKPANVTVEADKELTGVDLTPIADGKLGTVSGSVNIVNAPGGSVTSVVLAVKETFIESLEIGEVPRGLRATNVSNSFEIKGVPDGNYVVLASLDNDKLVRDPDTSISGTQIVSLTVTNGALSTCGFNFKVTEALGVVSPGAEKPEQVSANPTFTWKDDSSEDMYQLVVFNAFGDKVWEVLDVPPGKGSADVSVTYGGPALMSGMVYQFRATSMRKGVPISRTEELRGVFELK